MDDTTTTRTIREGHAVTTRPDRSLVGAPGGPGRRLVLNIWHTETGWERHEFTEPEARAEWERSGVLPGSDVRFSDR